VVDPAVEAPGLLGWFFQVIRNRLAGWTSHSPVDFRVSLIRSGTSSGSFIMAKVGRLMPLSRQ
jgi:hypothetical protein